MFLYIIWTFFLHLWL